MPDGRLPPLHRAVRLRRRGLRRVVEPGRVSVQVGASSVDLPLRRPRADGSGRRPRGSSALPDQDGGPLAISRRWTRLTQAMRHCRHPTRSRPVRALRSSPTLVRWSARCPVHTAARSTRPAANSASSAGSPSRPAARRAARRFPARRQVLRRMWHQADRRGGRRCVAPPPGTGPGSAPVAERRVVSILFADLVGFTTLAEGRDAEDTRELLSRLLRPLARCHRPLRRHGREVHRRRGDGGLGRTDRPRGRRRASRPGRRSSSSTRSGPSGRGSRRGPAS